MKTSYRSILARVQHHNKIINASFVGRKNISSENVKVMPKSRDNRIKTSPNKRKKQFPEKLKSVSIERHELTE